MVETVMDFAETVKTVEKMKKNAEANVAFANQLKANIVALQKSTAHDLVAHNGKVLVKVERKAREGDFVVFEGLESNYTINGKFYETYEKNGALCYTATDNLSYTVYGWGDFCEITKVYEVIGNLPQSNLVVEAFEPIQIENGTKTPCKHLTANQKRARAIKMAKDFVEEKIEETALTGELLDIETTIDTKKRKVKVEMIFAIGKQKGKAKCKKGEVFNEHIGEAIALAKALDIVEQLPPDILKAVQPDSMVAGHIILPSADSDIEVISNRNWKGECYAGDIYYFMDYSLSNGLKIIDDTNAQYETIKGGE